MDKIIPISDLQTKAKKYVDQVRETEQPVIVTQRGRASAVLVNYELYEGMLATLAVAEVIRDQDEAPLSGPGHPHVLQLALRLGVVVAM